MSFQGRVIYIRNAKVMPLPDKTEIFGIPYKIAWVKTAEVDGDKGSMLWGQIRFNEREIRISTEIGDRDKLVTLFEELVHGVFDEMDYGHLNKDHKFISPFVNGLFTALEKAKLIRVV